MQVFLCFPILSNPIRFRAAQAYCGLGFIICDVLGCSYVSPATSSFSIEFSLLDLALFFDVIYCMFCDSLRFLFCFYELNGLGYFVLFLYCVGHIDMLDLSIYPRVFLLVIFSSCSITDGYLISSIYLDFLILWLVRRSTYLLLWLSCRVRLEDRIMHSFLLYLLFAFFLQFFFCLCGFFVACFFGDAYLLSFLV